MALTTLEVRYLRNLTSAVLNFSPALNLIVGPNGSGKTSLLEAIHILGLGRSFRTQQSRKLVQDGQPETTVFGRIVHNEAGFAVGVQKREGDDTQIRINGEPAKSAAVLAELLPLQLITPESHALLQGEPQERRSFMDWGLFHVEHDYLQLWRRYRRALEQRNAALRHGVSNTELEQWDLAVAEPGEAIAQLRRGYLEQLREPFGAVYSSLLDGAAPRLAYRQGWSKELSLLETMAKNRESERAMGYTLAGPHRGELRLLLPGGDAVDILSRGQQKLAVCALRLAQIQHLRQTMGRLCTLLLDDLPAELDASRRGLLLQAVIDSGAQCFVTATDAGLVDSSPWPGARVFHVEHGSVREVV